MNYQRGEQYLDHNNYYSSERCIDHGIDPGTGAEQREPDAEWPRLQNEEQDTESMEEFKDIKRAGRNLSEWLAELTKGNIGA